MILNLGCGAKPMEGAINHGKTIHAPHINIAWDLNQTPWFGGTLLRVDEIYAISVLEHLNSFEVFFRECWHCLRIGGLLHIAVPHADSINVAIDPTHVRGYLPQSFEFLDRTMEWGKKAHAAGYELHPWKLLSNKLSFDGQDVLVDLQKVDWS